MKTLFILMNCCHMVGPADTTNWQSVVDAIPCICWGIMVLLVTYLIFKLIVSPMIKNQHEVKIKDMAFENEKYWAILKKIEEPTEKKLSELQKELYELKRGKEDVEKGKTNLEKEKMEFEKKILEERIKVYQEIIKH